MRQTIRTGFLQWVLAAGCAAVVFALGLFAASPTLHDQLHAGAHSPGDDGCAVALFAGGVSLSQPLLAPVPVIDDWVGIPFVESAEIFVDPPRYLLRPEHGPPLA